MKFLNFSLVLLFTQLVVLGQNVPKPFQSSALISEGIMLHDEQLYDSARVYFRQITRNDSLYGTVCYEIALGYYIEKEYDSALVYIKKAVNSHQTSITEQARTLMGSIFDDAGMPDSAIVCYQTALKSRPYGAGVWYDLGCTYYQMDSLDLAEQCLIQAITINPTYYKANYMLGRLNEKKNRRVEALLCYYMANLVNHSTDLVQLTELYLGGESDITSLVNEYVPTCPSFEKIEEYIHAKIAMTAKYKPVFKTQSAFVRQGDLLFKHLEYDPKVDNFYMNYYVQIFAFLRDKKYIETCMYAYFSVFNNENVQKWLKSNASKVQKFYVAMKDEIYRLAARGLVNDANYKGINYVYNDGILSEFGKYSDEKNKVKEGVWQFLERDGSVATTVNYQNGKPEGEMKSFNSTGQLVSTIPFVNGVRSGVGRGYYDNGQLQVEGVFENDKLNGKLIRYFPTGQKQREENYVNDIENGLFVSYLKNGAISDSVSWINGKQNGMYCFRYANNQLNGKVRIVNDLAEGEFVYYYPDGQLNRQGNFTKGNPSGKWIDYYPNGTLSAIYFYNDKGNLSDTAKYFDANGVLTSIFIYSANGKNIQKTFYRPDGSIYGKEEVKNDNPVKIESFDKEGKLVETINISNTGTHIKYYNVFGTVSAEGMIKNGKEEGRWIDYGLFGNIERISYYQNGERNETDTSFFPNGTIKAIENFNESKYDGYTAYYNLAGKIIAEGYCANDAKEGYWLYYNHFGKITGKAYFIDNEPNQWQEFYDTNGNLKQEIYYNDFAVKEIINYDSTGKEYERLTVPDSSCNIVLHYPNGKIMSEIHYIGGISNGKETHFHANGQQSKSSDKMMDKVFGTVTIYDEDGKQKAKREYLNDKFYGNITELDEDERVEINYFNDQAYDTIKYYNSENKLTTAIPYMDDEKHGLASYYAENGELEYQLLYYKGVAIEYISPKNNQPVPIENNQTITTYYKNGAKSAEMTFLNGYYDGTVKKYYPNGKIKEELFYVVGTRHGEQKLYNQQGGMVKKTVYYYGEMVIND